MERQRALKLALACGAAMSLQGCIAAAFPLAAGGLMAGGADIDADREEPTTIAEVEFAEAAAPVETPPSAAPARIEDQLIAAEPGQTAPPARPPVEQVPEPQLVEAAPETAPTAVGAADNTAEFVTADPTPTPTQTAQDEPVVAAAEERTSEITAVTVEAAPAPVEEAPAPSAAERAAMIAEPEPSVAPITPLPSSSAVAAAAAERAEVVSEQASPIEEVVPTTNEPSTSALAAVDAASSVESAVSAPASAVAVAVPTPAEPSAPVTPVVPAPSTTGATLFDPLFSYAASPEFEGRAGRRSAVLPNAAALNPTRSRCSQGNSTILIDLDPEGQELLPADPRSASPALSEKLRELRGKGVSIAWISRNPVEDDALIRAALFRAGLDQTGRDQLLLMRNAEDRKQIRRDQFAQTTCLIAIAGDEPSDFHELYDYLRNPADAAPLDPMFGEGWFIIPTPLLPEGAQ